MPSLGCVESLRGGQAQVSSLWGTQQGVEGEVLGQEVSVFEDWLRSCTFYCSWHDNLKSDK